ncbi:MAG: sigma-54 dependent transcriptional regulator [Saprospiraceae bacterium]
MNKDSQFRIFIVEDDPFYGELLSYHLAQNPDFEIYRFHSAKECLDNLYLRPSVITLDYRLPDLDGKTVLRKIKAYDPAVEVVIVSQQEEVSTAIELLRLGAYDYLVKNEETTDRLWRIIANIQQKEGLRFQIEQLQNEIKGQNHFGNLSGNSQPMKEVFQLIQKATQTNISVTISGETGTGKEMVAKSIHYNSSRCKYPFVSVNVAAIPRELVESELFGHEKGSFTGAINRRIGKFEEANNGTLFLDEIAEMDQYIQTKLLRIIQEKEFTRVGGIGTIQYDARIICATHKNLAEEVEAGRFREDLYYRLLGLPIHLPALRERGNDLFMLASEFMLQFCKENKLPAQKLSPQALEKIGRYPFPGNVRELKAVIELAIVLSPTNLIQAEYIQFPQRYLTTGVEFAPTMTMRQIENLVIQKALDQNAGDIIAVAKLLDIGKSTLYRKIKNGDLKLEK